MATAYLVLGLQIGGNFDAGVVAQLRRLGWFILLSTGYTSLRPDRID
jgi:uncharacterized membrane protein AbrB (regulator of aidB expression)